MEQCFHCGQGTIHVFACPEPSCSGRSSNRNRISICRSADCRARGCPFCHRPALNDDVLTRSDLLSGDATTESQIGENEEETSGVYLLLLDLKLLGRAFLV